VNQLHTIPQAAAHLAISVSSVRRLISDGRIAIVRPTAHTVRIAAAELTRYIVETTCQCAPMARDGKSDSNTVAKSLLELCGAPKPRPSRKSAPYAPGSNVVPLPARQNAAP